MGNSWISILKDAFLVETSDGRIVGYEEFFNQHEHARLRTDGYVHPDFRDVALAQLCCACIEQRAEKKCILPSLTCAFHPQ